MSTYYSYMYTLLTDSIKFVQRKKKNCPEDNDSWITIASYRTFWHILNINLLLASSFWL